MIFELVRDFVDALAALPRGHPKRRILALLEEAIRRDIHFIARHPTTLFQCMWNLCWWYDCPEAASYYDPPKGGWTGAAPWGQSGPKLHELLAAWRAAKQEGVPGSRWIRALRPPAEPLGTAQVAVFRGHAETGPLSGVFAVSFSPDGLRLATGSHDSTVRVWDVESGREIARGIHRQEHGDRYAPVLCTSFSPDGERVASGSYDNTVRVWNAETGEELARLQGHESSVRAVAFSPDGLRIASGGTDCTIRIWDAETGVQRACRSTHFFSIRGLAFSSDGRRILAALREGTVKVIDAETGEHMSSFRGPESWVGIDFPTESEGVRIRDVECVAFSPDLGRIVAGFADGTVRAWALKTTEQLLCVSGHGSRLRVRCVAFSPDGRRIVSGAELDPNIRVWDGESGQELACFPAHESGVASVAFSPSGRYILSGGDVHDPTVRLWDTMAGQHRATLKGPRWNFGAKIAFSHDGKWMAFGARTWGWEGVRFADWKAVRGGGAEPIELYDLKNDILEQNNVAEQHPELVRQAASWFSQTVRVWDAESAQEVLCLKGDEHHVNDIAVSSDDRRIVTCGFDNTIRIWDATTASELLHITGPSLKVQSIAFSADDRHVISGGSGICVWDSRTGKQLMRIDASAESAAFSPDERHIVTGSSDKEVRVWDAENGVLLRALTGHDDHVYRVAYSPDGRCIASMTSGISTGRQTVCLWDADTGELLGGLWGVADVSAIAAGPRHYPWRAISHIPETVVESNSTGKAVAWFPSVLAEVATHPGGRVWGVADYTDYRVQLLKLEGDTTLQGPRVRAGPTTHRREDHRP